MPPTPSDHDNTESAESRGLNRRSMMKKAAVAGAVAWTAPVIVGSLASPAAAGSVPGPCSAVAFTIARSGGTCTVTRADCGSTTYGGSSLCTSFAGAAFGAVSSTGTSCGTTGTSNFSVTGTNCTFVGYAITANPGTCPSSASFTAVPPHSNTIAVPYTGLNNGNTIRIHLAINCT